MDKLSILSLDSHSLDLSHSGISSLEPFLPRLSRFPRLHTLDISRNQITSLPADLSGLAGLKRLDLSQNPLDNVGNVVKALQSLQKLEVLAVDLDSEDEMRMLTDGLPRLVQVNGKQVRVMKGFSLREPASFCSDFLDKVQRLAEKVRKLRTGKDNFREERLRARLAELTTDLEAKEALPQQDTLQKRSVVLTKRAFIICLRDNLRAFIDPAAQSLSQELEQLDSELFEELSEVVLTLAPPSPIRSPRKIEDFDSVQLDLSPDAVKPQESAQKPRTNSVLLENIGLKAKIESLEMELEQVSAQLQDKTASEKQLMKQLTGSLAAQKSLEMELKGYQDLLQRERVRTVEQEALLLENQQIKARLDLALRAKDIHKYSDLRKTEDLTALYRSVSHERVRKSHVASLRGSTVGDGKSLSLKHVLITIAEVYSSKGKSDARNRDTHQPLETLSEHLQSYLNTKYGLKVKHMQSLRDRCSLALFSALTAYSKEDCDVELFSKLLRNQVEEAYRYTHDHFKQRILTYLRDNSPVKKRKRLDENSQSHLTLAEAKSAIDTLFPVEDREVLVSVLQEYVQHFVLRRGDFPAAKQVTKDSRVEVSTFLHVLLKYRLQQHLDFIGAFLVSFQRVDSDADGRVTQNEFKEMLRDLSVPISEEEVLELLRTADPDNLQVLALSQCAELFTERSAQGKRYMELFG